MQLKLSALYLIIIVCFVLFIYLFIGGGKEKLAALILSSAFKFEAIRMPI